MRKQYAKQENFTVMAIHEDEKLTGFFIADNNAIEYGYQLIECKGLLNE